MSDKTAALKEFLYDIDRTINMCEGIAYKPDVDGQKIDEAVNHLIEARKLLVGALA